MLNVEKLLKGSTEENFIGLFNTVDRAMIFEFMIRQKSPGPENFSE